MRAKVYGEEKGFAVVKVDEKRRIWRKQRLIKNEGFGGSKS